jgi:hypothetical protein
MRRMRTAALAAAALVTLVLAGAALAASLNTYTASVTLKQNGAGSAKKPVALGLVATFAAAPATPGDANADPLTNITLTLPKVTFHAAGFPVCSPATIAKARTDAHCPARALVATGPVSAALWGSSTPAMKGYACDPVLDVWNAGAGKLTYFFKIPAGHTCAGLSTGAVAPWTGSLREVHGALVNDTPLPPDVSTNAGNIGLYSSLQGERLTFLKRTETVKHHTFAFLSSVGCEKGSRPYTVTYTATNGSVKQTSAVKGSARC